MTDTSFNSRVRRDFLYTFRAANAPSFEFISASSFASAAELLSQAGIKPEVLQYAGFLVVPLRTDVEK